MCSTINGPARRTPRSASSRRELKVHHVPLPTLLSESDWIVPQLPTLPSTRDFLGRAELAQIKPGACIINVSNAAIINREALIEALHSRQLGGVALDVHYQEPVPDDDELLSFDNLILTPRMAGSPRFNGLNDFEQLITGLARELAAGNSP
jgi:phosphoglycerate dehydrogenase-like enzyme